MCIKRFSIEVALLLSLLTACGQPSPHVDHGGKSSQSTRNKIPQVTPRQPTYPTDKLSPQYKACLTTPDKESCACILYPKGDLCQCLQEPEQVGCICVLNPTSDECICKTDVNSLQCYCKQNPDAPQCQKKTPLELCVIYCKHRAKQGSALDQNDSLRLNLLKVDCDHDGLINQVEEDPSDPNYTATDPCDIDTDKDGLTDLEELYANASNKEQDSDGDSISDQREVDLGLNPASAYTSFPGRYGKSDADLWIVNACQNAMTPLESNPLKPLVNELADWQVLLPRNAEGTLLTLSPETQALSSRRGALFFDSFSQELSGGVISDEERFATSAVPILNGLIQSLEPSTYTDLFTTGESFTHDGFHFASASFTYRDGEVHSSHELRDIFFDKLSHFHRTEVTNYPSPHVSTRYSSYYVKISVIFRPSTLGKNQSIISYAFAPTEKYNKDELLQMRIEDLTNATNITQAGNEIKPICVEMQTSGNKQKLYFYFVLDESGTMHTYHTALSNIAELFSSKIQNTNIDYLLGVTNIIPNSHKSKLVNWTSDGEVHRWTKSTREFREDVRTILSGNGSAEYGLSIARLGIEKMRDKRPGSKPSLHIEDYAKIVTIWVTDEPDQGFIESNYSMSYLQKYIEYFVPRTTAFAIVEQPWNYQALSGGKCYVDVAQATGGAYGILSSDESTYVKTLNSIVDLAAGDASNIQLPWTPISSTLRLTFDDSYEDSDKSVHIRSKFIPRSLRNGYNYNSRRNTIVFNGEVIPEPVPEGVRGKDFILVYYMYDYKVKSF